MMVMVPVRTYLIKSFGRKKVWIISISIHSLLALHMLISGPFIISGVPVHVVFFMALNGAHAVIFWALIPDCVEFGQKDSGYRSEAGVYGSVLITQKMAGGLMGLFFGFVLASLGVSKDIQLGAEHAGSLTLFIILCPTIFKLLTIIPILLIPMSRQSHRDLLGQLERV